MHFSKRLGLGLPWTIKQINTRNNYLEGRRWAVEESAGPGKKKKGIISLRLILSSERGGITG
jgi:hypothetical protein